MSDKVHLIKCPRCGKEHDLKIEPFHIPKNGKVNEGQYTHSGICLSTGLAVLIRFADKGDIIHE